MRRYTVQDIMALGPCQPTEDDPDDGYPEDKLQRLFGNRRSVTLLEICDDDRVPIEDRQWVLHRLLPDRIVHEVACRYAEHILEGAQARGYEPDPRLWAAIAAKRQWLHGEISDVDLGVAESAARTAARDAVRTDAWTAADAAEAATWTAGWTEPRGTGWIDVRTAGWIAAEAAAEAAAWAAAEAAVRTAGAAVKSESGRTVWAAARDAERRWQLATLREMIEEMEDRNHQQGGKHMKVVRKDRRTVPFGSLRIGDQFEWDGDLYVKTSLAAEDHNTIRLSSPSCMVVRFAFTDYVHPVEIELHVFDKA